MRRGAALLCALSTLWAVVVTLGTDSLEGAWNAMCTSSLAQLLLKWELGDLQDASFSSAAALALYQSPLLLAGRSAVTELRTREETETPESPEAPDAEEPPPSVENAVQTPAAAEVADNGIAGRTIAPESPAGYNVVGGVYIKNTSICVIDEPSLGGSYAAVCPAEAPQVLIIHTHGSEAYTEPPGQEYVSSGVCRTTDDAKNVVKVGDEIAEVLSSFGLSVLHDRTLYDNPEYNGAYTRSLAAIEAYKAQYPSLMYILDIHRDAIEESDGSQCKVICAENPAAAQVALVLGTNGSGQSHDAWGENLKLALAVQRTAAAQYPTLMRPVYVRNSRYNQHITPGSLLVEVGTAGNSLAEAVNGGKLFAAALAKTILGQ